MSSYRARQDRKVLKARIAWMLRTQIETIERIRDASALEVEEARRALVRARYNQSVRWDGAGRMSVALDMEPRTVPAIKLRLFAYRQMFDSRMWSYHKNTAGSVRYTEEAAALAIARTLVKDGYVRMDEATAKITRDMIEWDFAVYVGCPVPRDL